MGFTETWIFTLKKGSMKAERNSQMPKQCRNKMLLSIEGKTQLTAAADLTNIRLIGSWCHEINIARVNAKCNSKKKGMVLYSAVSSPLDRSKRFTLSSPGRPVHSDTVLGFSWKHSSHAAIAQRLFNHISTTVYSQVGLLIYTAESTEAS